MGAEGTPFEGEIKAIKVAILNLIPRIHNFDQAVILIDSKAAVQAVVSNIKGSIHYRMQTDATNTQQINIYSSGLQCMSA